MVLLYNGDGDPISWRCAAKVASEGGAGARPAICAILPLGANVNQHSPLLDNENAAYESL
jgi:hypothetical protein